MEPKQSFMALKGVLFEDTMLGRKLYLNQGENYSALDWNSEGSPGKLQEQPRQILEVAFTISNVFKCIIPRQLSLVLETVSPLRIQV